MNSLAIIAFAPIMAWLWVQLGNANPSIPRKFGLGLIFNGLAFLLLMFALTSLLNAAGMIPFWTLFMVYVIQSIGELCLSPIGLSMVTKLAPLRLVGFGMGGWFLSTGIGNNLSGIFAGQVSGETGMTAASALSGYTFGFWAAAGRRRAAVPDRAADPEADARREVSTGAAYARSIGRQKTAAIGPPFFCIRLRVSA